mmetsp:Transcript_25297/g.27625  ORF Transcript_25297/g.27625 Transcript_25297/m.27625 type:complete len:617 (+) Transcript_25297:65-1915(+)
MKVFLVVDDGISESIQKQISDALEEFPSLGKPVLLSLEVFLHTVNTKRDYQKALVVAVCHGALDITNDHVSYFGMYNEYEFNQNITNIRKNCRYFWIAACWTGNIDVSTASTNYEDIRKNADNGDFEVKIIHPFIYSHALSGIPNLRVITVSYLLGMLNLFKEIDAEWYTRTNHPIDFYSEKNLNEQGKCLFDSNYENHLASFDQEAPPDDLNENQNRSSENHRSPIDAQIDCIRKVYQFMADFDTANDLTLFPNKLSFGEIFHCGVFVAHFPSEKLQVLANSEAVQAYLVARPKNKDKRKAEEFSRQGRFKFLSSDVAESGNKWFKQIVEFACPQIDLRPYVPATTVAEFQCSGVHKFPKHYDDTKIRLSLVDIQKRLMCCDPLPQEEKRVPKHYIALVIRDAGHDEDFRVASNSNEFYTMIQNLMTSAKKCDHGIALMDGGKCSDDVWIKCLEIALEVGFETADLKNLQRGCSPGIEQKYFTNKENDHQSIVSQLRYIYKCVQCFNIVGALGVHGTFMDMLVALGVPASKTIRVILPASRTLATDEGIDDVIAQWKTRVSHIMQRFGNLQGPHWIDNHLPSSDKEFELIFATEALDIGVKAGCGDDGGHGDLLT